VTPITKQWKVLPKLAESYLEQFEGPQRLVSQILHNRGITSPEDVANFINCTWDNDDPFQLKDMPKAVERLAQAINRHEPIIVYGDYDVDGITATAVMMQCLLSLGARVQHYIPHRFDEGYGLNNEAMETLAGQGVKLIVTVDCGIRSVQEVALANSLGVDVILTDHHSVGPEIPPALAVINPKQPGCTYPFAQLAGVGLAYKLVQALAAHLAGQQQLPAEALLPHSLLDLVAMGTVADLAPLVGENRKLVTAGLQQMNQSLRPGLAALLDEAGNSAGTITAETIGFVLGPRLNAAGRLDSAQAAYHLLMVWSRLQAQPLAQKLNEMNRERQQQTRAMVDIARQEILADNAQKPLYLISHPDFNPGVVGLAASRLTEEFYRPTLVAEKGPEHTKGSARSIPEFNITEALDQCQELFIRYGGHSAAAGFTLSNENVASLYDRLLQIATGLNVLELHPTMEIDAEIVGKGLHLINDDYMQALAGLEPFGNANPAPIFMTRHLRVKQKKAIGQDGHHLRLVLHNGSHSWSAIGFRLGHWAERLNFNQQVDVVYALEYNEWNGQRQLQLNIKDIRPSDQ
jgi:single-stranded-DNA-specific exonuclease